MPTTTWVPTRVLRLVRKTPIALPLPHSRALCLALCVSVCLSHSLTGSLVCAGEASSYKSQQSDIKAKAKAAYQQAEKETTIGSVVFDQGPLTKGITACDLGVPSHRLSLFLTHTRARAHTHSLTRRSRRWQSHHGVQHGGEEEHVQGDGRRHGRNRQSGGRWWCASPSPPLPRPFGPSPVRCACV